MALIWLGASLRERHLRKAKVKQCSMPSCVTLRPKRAPNEVIRAEEVAHGKAAVEKEREREWRATILQMANKRIDD